MALTPIGLCSRALIKIGAGSITSFNDGTAEAEVADALYGSTRDAVLSANSWSFATTQATLALLADPPLGDYDYAHALPVDFLRALSAGSPSHGRGLGYRIVGTTLQTDAEQVTLTYVYRPAEAVFPPFFDQVVIARLAAEFCLPLTENSSRAEALAKLAELEFRRARLIDNQQDSQLGLEDFTLIEARA
jgi:hypothetical protein